MDGHVFVLVAMPLIPCNNVGYRLIAAEYARQVAAGDVVSEEDDPVTPPLPADARDHAVLGWFALISQSNRSSIRQNLVRERRCASHHAAGACGDTVLPPPPQSAVADTVCEAVFELVQHFVDVGANTSADPVATIQAAHDERLSWWRAQDVSDVYVGTGMGHAWPSHPNITLRDRKEAEAVKRVETGFAHLERLGCMFKSAAALAATSSGGSLTAQDRDRRKTQEKLGRLVHVVYRHLGSRLDMLEAFLRKKRFKFVSAPSPPTLAVPRADQTGSPLLVMVAELWLQGFGCANAAVQGLCYQGQQHDCQAYCAPNVSTTSCCL